MGWGAVTPAQLWGVVPQRTWSRSEPASWLARADCCELVQGRGAGTLSVLGTWLGPRGHSTPGKRVNLWPGQGPDICQRCVRPALLPAALRRLRGWADVEDEMEEMRVEAQAEQAEGRLSVLNLFTFRPVRWQLISIIVLMAGQQLSGINAVCG